MSTRQRRGEVPVNTGSSHVTSLCTPGAGRQARGMRYVESGSPVLHLSRRALCADKVVNVSRTAFRPDRFTMYVQLGDPA